ncbi:hypothetical protein A0H81_11710 [Grifola frondosa]|uniref:Cryptic loci regulator 2 N-terminal domain-containing protein n=1 Tax=Grifola frondosa TaxID=5627 RepID=A0A1C7LTQ2_GRIFR|nr:hypothetical protein A0H81_11710 [Grifola frondosa]
MTSIIKTDYYEAFDYAGKALGIVLTPFATDAVPGRDPLRTRSDRDENGMVDYYEEADEKSERFWRMRLGEFLALHVVREDMLKEGMTPRRYDRTLLSEFPEGYKLWVHKKGDPHDPRKDFYLHGSRYVRQFRSPMEFCLHLKWLANGKPMKPGDKPDCQCCYCDGSQRQGAISAKFGYYHPGHHDQNKKRKDKDKDGDGKGKRRSTASVFIPAKDYTKLNVA